MDVARPLRLLPVLTLMLAGCGAATNSSPAAKLEKTTSQCEGAAIPTRFIVHWKNGATSVEVASDREALVRDVITPNNEMIDWAEHDYRVSLPKQPTGDGDLFTAMASGAADPSSWGQADIHAAEAWTLATGEGITVAVVDSGSDITHPQLKNQIAVNTKELNGKSGVDDDGNGYVDDIYGYDFYADSGDIKDAGSGHGTHVSGVIAAEHISSSYAPKGVAPGAKLIPLNFMDGAGSGNITQAVQAIDYAVARGAKIINASWGGEFCSTTLKNKIGELEAHGVLFVAAAGNGDANNIGFNIEDRASYPAAYDFPSVLTVGAINSLNRMTGFSNFGRKLVAIVAPGLGIRSTYPTANKQDHCEHADDVPGYCTLSGTSMATPFVAGAAAVVWSYRPKATLAQVRLALLSSVVPGDYAVASKGRLDLRKALDQIASIVASPTP